MKKFFMQIPTLKVSFLAFIVSIIFINFFISPSYKSQSILDISTEDDPISTGSIFDSFVSSGPEDAFQLKSFLTSTEASLLFQEAFDIKKLFSNNEISFFSKYKQRKRSSFHDYYLSKVALTVDPDSNSLIIDTFAFDPVDALQINLQLINMSADFFNRKARMQSFNIKTSKICELYSINSDILNQDLVDFKEDYSIVGEADSANDLLMTKSMRYKEECLNRLNTDDNDLKNNSDIFPFFELKNINADASKQVLLEIYDKSLDSVTASNNLKIIAEPTKASVEEVKNITLYSILVFAVCFISILSLKILLRLNDEFET